jgi:hypothetical protein
MLSDDIKKRMMQAMKAGRVVEKEILRVAVGEITMTAARAGKDVSDAEVQTIVRKLLKSNEETLTVSSDAAQQATLREENEILQSLLPKALGVDEIADLLAGVSPAIRDAKSEGQAIGVAMKELKSKGAIADGKLVGEAVARLRSPT